MCCVKVRWADGALHAECGLPPATWAHLVRAARHTGEQSMEAFRQPSDGMVRPGEEWGQVLGHVLGYLNL